MTAATDAGRYARSVADSRVQRNTSRDALHLVENALSAPAPGRERAWLREVVSSIDELLEALCAQAGTDPDKAGLLSDIAVDKPRLADRVARLRLYHDEIIAELRAINRVIVAEPDAVDVEVLRDELSDIARRYRWHRSQEADLVYEAVNVDLGGGD